MTGPGGAVARASPPFAQDLVSEPALRGHVETITGFGPRAVDDEPALRATVELLRDTLAGEGRRVEVVRFGDGAGDVNVIAEIPGHEADAAPLEIGAHYDTAPGSPGADDNASAIAVLLEISRLLAEVAPRRGVRLCLFGREESGMEGSRFHVRNLGTGAASSAGAVVLEMVGCRRREPGTQRTPLRIPFVFSPPRAGDFIAVLGNLSSRALARRFVRACELCGGRPERYVANVLPTFLPDAARSDHSAYWRAGRPAILLTDTADFRNPRYHQPADTPDTLDYEFLREVAAATATMVMEWARGAR